MLLEQFQIRSGFKFELGKTYPISSQTGRSIPTLRDMHLLL